MTPPVDRRDLLRLLGATTAGTLGGCGVRRNAVDWSVATTSETTFGDGTWPDRWHTDGVANREAADGLGVLAAGTDLYPASRRALAFQADARATDARVRAHVARPGVGPGVVLRRVGPQTAYLAVVDLARNSLAVLAREGFEERVVASRSIGPPVDGAVLELAALGTDPTTLHATLEAPDGGRLAAVSGTDRTPTLQRPGDPGVLATAETGLTPEPEPTPGALEQWRLLGVGDFAADARESRVPYDEAARAAIERASTTAFDAIEVATRGERATTTPSTVAAGSRYPTDDGVAVRIVSDVPATVAVDVAPTAAFEEPTRTDLGATNDYRTVLATVPVPFDGTVHWRPVLSREGRTSTGPVRQVRSPTTSGATGPVSLAVGACATRFGTTFESIAALDPDVFVWEGDLNYPDSMGLLAQTHSGYAGLWKALLRTPELAPLVASTYVGTARDDHDYGQNDATRAELRPYGVEPYEHVLESETYYAFGLGPIDAWVLDTRKWRDPHDEPDTPEKTLLGDEQLRWLERGLAASTAPFNVVCSPGPLFNVPNPSFSWAKGFTAERDRVLSVVDERVSGEVVFLTGDTHSGCVTRDRGVLEIRAAPLDMPEQAWHATSSGDSVRFAENGTFFAYLEATGSGTDATLSCSLRYGDGDVAWATELPADEG